ncbi:MAG: T9SS type A sorting domain-containing protein [Ignavibacteria bacterium]|nr:T9SS type A sorting domain-containing protein [Ignavibacteria bacterium]
MFFSICSGQVVNIPIKISDGAASDTLMFGLDPSATNGIDLMLNENELPPLPPAGIFDARFTGTGLTPPVPIGNGLERDYREGNANYSGEKKHRIKYQTGSGSVIIISWWNVPSEMSIRLQDIVTGSLIDTTFSGSGSYLITNTLGFSSLNFTVNYSFITSSQNEILNTGIPESLTLLQNYPNPFNPVTSINYHLSKNDFINLSVYNSSGELVQVLINSYTTAGIHEIVFDASDLPSGVYFYKIRSGEYTNTKSMLLLK